MSPFFLNGEILPGTFAALCQTLIQKPPGLLINSPGSPNFGINQHLLNLPLLAFLIKNDLNTILCNYIDTCKLKYRSLI